MVCEERSEPKTVKEEVCLTLGGSMTWCSDSERGIESWDYSSQWDIALRVLIETVGLKVETES